MTFSHLGTAFLISLLASSTVSAQQATPDTALAEAEARWKAHKPAAYEFKIEVLCFCVGVDKLPSLVRVLNGVTQRVDGLDINAQRMYASVGSVESLFEVVRRHMSFGQYKIWVDYDKELGYPVTADLDPRREVDDDEMVFRVREFRQVPPPTAEAEAAQLVRRLGDFQPGMPGTVHDNPPNEEFRRSVYVRLRELGPVAVAALRNGLADSDVQVRRNVALYLGWEAGNYSKHMPQPLDLKPFGSALVAALRDSDERVKGLSAQAVGHLGADGAMAVPELLRLLADPSEGLRNSACIALAGIGQAASAALPALQRALSDPSPDVRKFAQSAIDKISRKTPEP